MNMITDVMNYIREYDKEVGEALGLELVRPVSYTHLTLPTKA